MSFLRREKFPKYFIFGLDGCGKTTIVKRLDKERGAKEKTSRRAMTPEYFIHENVWDDCEPHGRDTRFIFFYHVPAVMYVIDSTDVDRLGKALNQLELFLRPQTQAYEASNIVLMIVANKQDLDGAVNPETIETRVNELFNKYKDNFYLTLFVMPCCAIRGKSLLVAYDYFVEQVKLIKRGKLPVGVITSPWVSTNPEFKFDWTDDTAAEGEKESPSTFAYKLKKLALKNPLKALKSVLSY